MDAHDLEITLTDTGEATGEISFADISAITRAMQDLATSVGRLVAEQEGPGRTVERAARVTRLRLRCIAQGSTKLSAAYGEHDALDLDVGLESVIAARFWEIVEGVSTGQCPSWVTPQVADATLRMMNAFSHAASRVELARGDHAAVAWRSDALAREPWQVPRLSETEEIVTVSGRLEAVDLATDRFRIRDDVGNKIILTDVPESADVGKLIGRRAAATGTAVRGHRLQLVAVDAPLLVPVNIPAEWSARSSVDATSLAARYPGPDPDGGVDLNDDEYDDFMATLREC